MEEDLFLIEVVPKVPARMLSHFLKGIGCTEVSLAVQNNLEGWFDFKFLGASFEGHQDGEIWRFFGGKRCSPELTDILIAKIALAQHSFQAWAVVWKGVFRL